MDCAFDAGLKPGAEVGISTGGCGLGTYSLQQALCPKTSVNFSNSDGASAWLLIKGYKTVCHHGSIGSPRRVGIGEPIHPCCHLSSQSI